MVVGARASEIDAAYRRGHRLGNVMLTGILARMFGRSFSDILSGYRVFSRRFVKSFPVLREGFELETAISVDRKRVVSGKSVSVRVDLGGRRTIQQKNDNTP